MTKRLNWEEVLEIAVKSYFLDRLIGVESFDNLKREFPDYTSMPARSLISKIENLEDSVLNINTDEFLSFRLTSDDEGGSESGPWHVNVFGACGVWMVHSIEYDKLWFSDRESAIAAAYDYAHESIIEELDNGTLEFQQTNSEFDFREASLQLAPSTLTPTRIPEKRVLDFYIDPESNITYEYSKYGSGIVKSDICNLLFKAVQGSNEQDIFLALEQASFLRWKEAERAINIALDIRRKVSVLEDKLEQVERSRAYEIEVDDWIRNNAITNPTIEDFKRMANSVKPYLHYREASQAWDSRMPAVFQDAYLRLKNERKRIADLRTMPDEE
jgi:hypothetical protein